MVRAISARKRSGAGLILSDQLAVHVPAHGAERTVVFSTVLRFQIITSIGSIIVPEARSDLRSALQLRDLALQTLNFRSQSLIRVGQLDDVLIHVDQFLRSVGVLGSARER